MKDPVLCAGNVRWKDRNDGKIRRKYILLLTSSPWVFLSSWNAPPSSCEAQDGQLWSIDSMHNHHRHACQMTEVKTWGREMNLKLEWVFIVNQQEFHGEYEDYLPILMKHTEINAEMIGCTGSIRKPLEAQGALMRIKDKQNHGCLNGLMRADATSAGKKQVMPNQVVRAT